MKEVFTTSEAARICNISKQKIVNLFDQGEIEGFKIPGPPGSKSRARRIPRKSLLAFMQKHGIPTEALDQEQSAERKKKVLIVEDDKYAQELLQEILRVDMDVIEVHSAESGSDAGVLAGSLLPDLILLDLALPDIDGDEVFRSIRKVPSLSHTRVMVITAHSDDETRKRLVDAGVDAFLAKPISAGEVRKLVRHLLELPEEEE